MYRFADWATLAITSPLMMAGLVVVAVSTSWSGDLAGMALVLAAAAALAAPVAPVRIGGLAIALAVLSAGLQSPA